MKQHITPKQAKEIADDQFYSLIDLMVKRDDWANYHHKKVTIGKMIEYLSDKEWNILIERIGNEYRVTNNVLNGRSFARKLLCDALWDAVKDTMK